ncbi:nuclear transport factor 2 family protein [Pollutibacter soli]|uniref:nuclear transport factor 2 family protein n=1 Tax=Pollutibacter soli TaxID=3034157 RepID=UPI003013478D
MNASSLNEFQNIDNNLNAAFESNDVSKITPLISEDWFLLDPQFGITPGDKFLSLIRSGNLVHISMKKTVQKVIVENDIAIVISKGINHGQYNNVEFNAEHWVTQTYKRTNGNWICMISQEMPAGCLQR